jgi:hypothetical protein
MKIGIIGIVVVTALAKCGTFDEEPTPHGYQSIAVSKENHVFLSEYHPQSPYFEIEGRSYKIEEAWVEHPHKGSDDSPINNGYDFVMTFEPHAEDGLNFRPYMKELGWGTNEIWFFLSKKKYDKDTLEILYKECLKDSIQESFKLFKQK